MKLVFHPAARDEFVAAAEYYSTAVSGLGDRFLVAVRRASQLVLAHPEAGGRRDGDVRRMLISGFPYDLVYRVRADALEVLALAHHRRRPNYWRSRVTG